MNARGVDFTGLAYLAALGLVVGVGGYVIYKLVSSGPAAAKEAAGKVLDAVNPVNPNNVVARGVNTVVQAATGDPYDTLGTALWRFFNPGKVAKEKAALAPDASGTQLRATFAAQQYTGSYGDDAPLVGGPNFG